MTRRRLIVGEVVHVRGTIASGAHTFACSMSCEVLSVKPLKVQLILAGGEPDPEHEPIIVTRAQVELGDEPFLVTRLAAYQPGEICSGVCRCGRPAKLYHPALPGRSRAKLACWHCPSLGTPSELCR